MPTGVLASPMIPGLNDHELESVLEAAADAGASSASYMLLRLPHELKTLFSDWLAVHAPARRGKVLSLLKQSKGGRLNDPRFGYRMKGVGPIADLLQARFQRVAKARGLDERIALREDRFAPPPLPGTQARMF